MEENDVRWIQRLANYKKALAQLTRFIQKGALNELEEQGLIQSFEYTYELGWNVIKDFYESQGETNIQGSKDAIRIAFQRGLIKDGENWMEMVKSRALTSHTYNEETAKQISQAIGKRYYSLFIALRNALQDINDREAR